LLTFKKHELFITSFSSTFPGCLSFQGDSHENVGMS